MSWRCYKRSIVRTYICISGNACNRAADPTKPMSETLHGKLPQKKLVTGAAHGYSSYGNQIGLQQVM